MRKYTSLTGYNPLERKIFNEGSFGIIYENDDNTLIKILRFKTTNPYVILKIKELNLENFYHIIATLCDKNNDKEYLKAYQMEKIIEDDTDILSDNNYLIRNIKILMNSFNTLSENYILVNDLHEDNMIINKDGIHVIDCDNFRYYPEYKLEAIKKYNNDQLKEALYYLLNSKLKEKNRISFIKQLRLKKLFDNDLKFILNELSNYNSVMGYVKKKK